MCGIFPVPLLCLHVTCHHLWRTARRSNRGTHCKISNTLKYCTRIIQHVQNIAFAFLALECHRVLTRCFYDWSGLLSLCWSASHHSGQHRSCACFWENPLQVLQVCSELQQLLFFYVFIIYFSKQLSFHPSLIAFVLPFSFNLGTTNCPICRSGLASAYGQPCCVSCWLPQMLALWCVTSLGSQRRPLPPSYASYSFMRPWRSYSTWEKSTPSTLTPIWTNSHWRSE